jgi:hypothetical protein
MNIEDLKIVDTPYKGNNTKWRLIYNKIKSLEDNKSIEIPSKSNGAIAAALSRFGIKVRVLKTSDGIYAVSEKRGG